MNQAQKNRQRRMAILAQANTKRLVKLWALLNTDPEFSVLRAPETGIIGLRGRIGGGGDPFNFGEATITRATIKLASGEIGHAYALGQDHTKVKLSAILDALAQDKDWAERIDESIVAPLEAEIVARDSERASQTAATKVDFFTMVRGED